MTPPPLFDDSTRRKLEQLMLHAAKVRSGAVKGERRSVKRGTSVEFADYRSYSPGDDLRRIDWNLYGRLDRPMIKLYEDEEDLAVHVLLDASASMNYPREGDPAQHKFDYARRLMTGLATISLASNDRVSAAAFGARTAQFGPARGRGYGVRLLNFAVELEASGVADLDHTLKDYALRGGRAGLCFIISDMMTPHGYIEGLNALVGKGYEVALIHVLAREEIEPTFGGDLRLIDSETGAAQEVSIDGGLRALYMRRVTAWRDGIRADCTRRGVHFVSAITDGGWERLILTDLRRLGLVK
jgi:uncharacterized protein (DUF58 family)